MSFALMILENVLRMAEENGARAVKKIRVEVGELLMVNPDQLEFCFRAISKNTPAENADLEIETLKAKSLCQSCGSELESVHSRCSCGGWMEIRGGKEIVLRRIEMEVEDAQDRN